MQIIVKNGNMKRTAYFLNDPDAKPYITFLRKVSRGVSVSDAAEQTIGASRGTVSVTFGGFPYLYTIRFKNGAVIEEQLNVKSEVIVSRKAQYTTIARAAARDIDPRYTAIPETAYYTEESHNFRDFLFDAVVF